MLTGYVDILVRCRSTGLNVIAKGDLPRVLKRQLNSNNQFVFFVRTRIVTVTASLTRMVNNTVTLGLLFKLPLFVNKYVVNVVSAILLVFRGDTARRVFRGLVVTLLLIVAFKFVTNLFVSPPGPTRILRNLIPRFGKARAMLVTASVLNTAIVPRTVCLRSALIGSRCIPKRPGPDMGALLRKDGVSIF